MYNQPYNDLLKEKLEYGVIKDTIKGICRERLCNKLGLEALSLL